MKRFISISAVSAFLASSNLYACSICYYGDPSSKANTALRWSVLVLLIILLVVLSAFASFFISLRKRSKILSQHIH